MSSGQSLGFSALYQYALIGAVGVVLVLVVLLCFRSRILERRRVPLAQDGALFDEEKPQLYDAYLDSGHGEELWHEIMPVSIHRVGVAPLPVSLPLGSALSTVTMMIVMPSPPNDILPPPPRNLNPPNDPDRRNPSSDLDSDSDSYVAELPYLEFGITDVGVLASKP
ncbi:hypothetical protein B0H13DRAFT_2035542 [Mycena leptocephala]|nr:hypothetical protein B0H13DRAFT_2035542 [Mycena leptocephala]